MLWIIIIVIVGYIVYSINKDYNKNVKNNISNKERMLVKYKQIIDYLLSGGLSLQKVGKDSVIMSSKSMRWTLDYVEQNLEVRMNGVMPMLGIVDKKWIFPDGYPQEKMIEEIENFITWKLGKLKDVAQSYSNQHLKNI